MKPVKLYLVSDLETLSTKPKYIGVIDTINLTPKQIKAAVKARVPNAALGRIDKGNLYIKVA